VRANHADGGGVWSGGRKFDRGRRGRAHHHPETVLEGVPENPVHHVLEELRRVMEVVHRALPGGEATDVAEDLVKGIGRRGLGHGGSVEVERRTEWSRAS
jgi:hypothetical protein